MSGATNYDFLSQDNVRPMSDTISKWQGVQKNALDIQQAQAQVEQGKAAQAAIDPNTGQFDQAKYNQLLAANPMAARGAVAAAQAGVTLDTDTYKLHTARMGQANDALGTLIGRYPNGIPQDAANAAIDQEVGTGLITPAQAQQLKTQFGADTRQNSVVATQLYSHNMTTQQQLERIYGTNQPVTDPSGTQIVTVRPPSPNAPNVVVPAGQSPGGGGAQVTWVDSNNVTHYGTQAQYQQARGVDPRIGPQTPVLTPPPTAPAQPGSNAPPPPPGHGTIRSPGAYTPPAANAPPASSGVSVGGKVPPTAPGPQSQNVPPASNIQVASADNSFVPSGAAGAPAAAPSGAVAGDVAAMQAGRATAQATPSGAVPGAVAAAGPGAGPTYTDTTGPPAGFVERLKQDQDQYATDQRSLPAHYTNTQNLHTALDALQLANTGRSTGAVHNIYSFLSSQGIAPGFVDNDVTQYDIARKAMMAFAASRASAGGTDLARVQSELSNASPEISQAAALHVLKQNLGLENMEIAANLQQNDKSGAGYGDSKSQFYQKYDPRGFAWDSYDPGERQTIMDAAKKTTGGLDKLRASVQKAIDLHLIQVPAQSSQAAPASNGGPASAPAPANPLMAASSGGPPNALAA